MKLKLESFAYLLAVVALVTFTGHAADGVPSLLVKWKDGPNSAAAAAGNSRVGGRVIRNFNQFGWQQVGLPAGLTLSEGLEAYRRLDTVLIVEPDRRNSVPRPTPSVEARETRSISRHSQTPNDPRFASQWALKKVSAPAAWDVTTGSTNVVVAFFDTGVDYTHPDLSANMWRNPGETGLDSQGHDKATNRVDDDGNGYVDDVHGVDLVAGTGDPMDRGYYFEPYVPASAPIYHGTFIAGVIGAVGNNATGIAGINWSVQIMAIRILDEDQADPGIYFTDQGTSRNLAAWDYVLLMKRRGVNIGVTSHSEGLTANSAAEQEAILAAAAEGILTVVSAGNDSVNHDLFATFHVSNLAPVILVANSEPSDTLNSGSDFGPSTVDLAAPGSDILSTAPDSSYRVASGTSYSCPLVAGAAALLLSVNPDLTVDQMKAALLGSVDQPASLRNKLITQGRLNVARALDYLTNASPPAIIITALPAGQQTPTNFPIQVSFNRAMNRASVEAAFVIQPPVVGTFDWSADSHTFFYRHDAAFDPTTNYTVRILGSAQDEVGGTLDGNYNRIREGSPVDDRVWTFRFPVANDRFENAKMLAGNSGSERGSNRYTGWEDFEPFAGTFYDPANIEDLASVWYRWTAPASGGWVTFDLTSGTAFDSYLAVYTGDRLEALSAVAGNDNYGTRTSSRVSFAATAGSSYALAVIGKSGFVTGQSGPFMLTWYPTPPPGFTGTQFTPLSAIPGAAVRLTGTNFAGATAVLFNGASASFTNALTNNFDLRITAVVPPDATSGAITIVTPHGNVTSTAVFQVLPPPLTFRLLNASQLEITWLATSRAFVLETSADLNATVWPPLAQAPDESEGMSRLVVGVGSGPRFYRLKQY